MGRVGERDKPFARLCSATSAYILTEYPDIEALAAIPLDDLAELLNTRARGLLKGPTDIARKRHQVAQRSSPLPADLATAVHAVLTHTLDHIRFLERQRNTYQALLADQLAVLPEANLALAGLGTVLVAGCLGEIQACTELAEVTPGASPPVRSTITSASAGASALTVTVRPAWPGLS